MTGVLRGPAAVLGWRAQRAFAAELVVRYPDLRLAPMTQLQNAVQEVTSRVLGLSMAHPVRVGSVGSSARIHRGVYRHAIDFVALRRELLDPLGPGGTRAYRASVYDIRARHPNVSPIATAGRGKHRNHRRTVSVYSAVPDEWPDSAAPHLRG